MNIITGTIRGAGIIVASSAAYLAGRIGEEELIARWNQARSLVGRAPVGLAEDARVRAVAYWGRGVIKLDVAAGRDIVLSAQAVRSILMELNARDPELMDHLARGGDLPGPDSTQPAVSPEFKAASREFMRDNDELLRRLADG